MKNALFAFPILLLAATTILAQPDRNTPASSGDSLAPAPTVPEDIAVGKTNAPTIHQELDLDYSYVGGSGARNQLSGAHYGDSDEQASNLKYNLLIPVSKEIGASFGVDYNRFDFGNPSSVAAIPQNIEAVSPNIGASYKLDSQWTLFGRFAPEIENLNNWSQSQYVRYTGAVGSLYTYSRDLQFTFGLAINPGTIQTPVLPLLGMRWAFAPDWTLLLGFPRSAVEYRVNKKWVVGVGPSFEGGEFRTDSSYGTAFGRPDLDNQHFYYREIRAGFTSDYALAKSVSLTAEVGSSVYREIDFKDDGGYRIKDEPAPYGQVGLKFRF